MPRRSARIRDKMEEQKELESELPESTANDESTEPTKPTVAANAKNQPKAKAKAKGKGRAKAKAKLKSKKKSTSNNNELEEAKENEMSVTNDEESASNENMAMDSSRSPESPTDVDTDINMHEMEQKDQSESQSLESSVEVSKPLKRLSLIPSDIDNLRAEQEVQAANTMDVDEADKADANNKPNQDESDKVAEDSTATTTTTNEPEQDDENEEEEEAAEPMVRTRARRQVQTISYKDDSSTEEEDDDEDDPMFAGLSKAEREAMKAKMSEMQSDYVDSVRQEREQKLREIIDAFDLNIGATVTMEEAAFIHDFCAKFQENAIEKIEDDGDFFLEDMRDKMQEKIALLARQMEESTTSKNKRGRRGRRRFGDDDDSESEFDMNDYTDSDSEYSMDSDWEHPDEDNENMISDEEDGYGGFVVGDRRSGRRGKRRRNKNVWRDESGREYYAKGRLLLNDALKDTENFEGWSAARVQAWKNKDVNPNAYYYRFNDPGEEQINGAIKESEHKGFMERVMEMGVNQHWGLFSKTIKGRVGYQCSNYWRQMMKDGWVKDPNYWIRSDGSFQFKRAKKGSIPDAVRKYSFVVIKDPSKTFHPLPGTHPKRPSDKTLEKYLERDVRELNANQKKGGKKGKKNSRQSKTKDEEKEEQNETTDNKEVKEDEEAETDVAATDNKEDGDGENKKSKKKKKGKKEKKSSSSKKGKSKDKKKDKDKKKKDKTKKKKKKKKDKESADGEANVDGDDTEENVKDGEDKKSKKKKKKDKKSKSNKKDKKKKSKKKEKEAKKEQEAGEEPQEKEEDTKMDGTSQEAESSDSSVSGKRARKRKHDGSEASEFQPPSKKRKTGKKQETSSNDENGGDDAKNEDPLSIIRNMTDIMTGQKMKQPAISPFGYVMDYNSWCSILRNPRTKNKCPFTKKTMTRRQLVKLDADNIEEYKDKIVNITAEDMKNFNS